MPVHELILLYHCIVDIEDEEQFLQMSPEVSEIRRIERSVIIAEAIWQAQSSGALLIKSQVPHAIIEPVEGLLISHDALIVKLEQASERLGQTCRLEDVRCLHMTAIL